MKINVLILLSAVVFFTSCKSSSTSPSTNNNNGGLPPANTMYITVGGNRDTLGTEGATVTNSGKTTMTITGQNVADTTCVLTLENISTTGTYDVGTGGLPNSVNGVVLTYTYLGSDGTPVGYSSTGTSSVGSLGITSISSTAIQATFTGTGPLFLQYGNGPQKDTITNVVVNATIQ